MEADQRLNRLYDAIDAGLADSALKERMTGLKPIRDQAMADAAHMPLTLTSKSELLRTLIAASSGKSAAFGVHRSVRKWRARNPVTPACLLAERASSTGYAGRGSTAQWALVNPKRGWPRDGREHA